MAGSGVGFISKVKGFFTEFVNAFRGIVMRIPVTFTAIVIFNIFVQIEAFLSEHDIFDNKNSSYMARSFVMYVVIFSIFLAIGTFLLELLTKKRIFTICGTVAAAGISAFITYKLLGYFIITKVANVFENDDFTERTALCTTGYVIIILCVALFVCIKKSNISFFSYAMRIFVKFFQIFVISIVMLMGSGLIALIINELFFSNSSHDIVFEIYTHCAMLIGGMYALPFSIYALIEPECEINRFMEVLVKYVMHVISLTAYVIIYIYMIKILITREIPSNSIFAICTALFVCSMIIAIMCVSFEIKGVLQKLAFVLPYVFIPFILLQIYSVGVRIRQYGLTPERYIGTAFITFEILYIILYAINMQAKNIGEEADAVTDEKMKYIFLVIAVIAAFSAFAPGVNVLTASKNSQVSTIKKYLNMKDGNPSNELIKKAYGSTLYIKTSDYGEDYLRKIISDSEFDKLTEARKAIVEKEDVYISHRRVIQGNAELDNISISGFNTISAVKYSVYNDLGDGPVDLGHIVLNTGAEDMEEAKSYLLDLNELFEEYKKVNDTTYGNVFETCSNRISLSDDAELIITDLNIGLNDQFPGNCVESMRIFGYVLAK